MNTSIAQPVGKGLASLSAHGLSKTYGGIRALSDLSLTLRSGQVHALLGENGAGKSTFIKMLAGAVRPDEGTFEVDGNPVTLHSPHDATTHGLAFIHQDPSLVGTMSVAENMFLGTALYSRRGITGRRRLRDNYTGIAERVGLSVHPDTLAEQLPVAQQTLVAIGRALAQNASIIVMDEPTATFSDAEAQSLFTIISDLTRSGAAILYVSHRLDEVLRIADVITVLKNGKHVTTLQANAVRGRDHLVDLIVGETAAHSDAIVRDVSPQASPSAALLSVEHVGDGRRLRDATLTVRPGEIVGLTGLVGSGRTELAKVIFGASRMRSGRILLDDKVIRLRSPHHAVRMGIALVPEDRRGEGAFMHMTLRDNTTLPILPRFQVLRGIPVLRAGRERIFVRSVLDKLAVKYASTEQIIGQLSGGNQQKVVIAKWTATRARLIVVDEPTQGVDVGAKAEIYAVIRQLAADGAGVLLISSEIEEVIANTDRVVVMREGRTVADLSQPTEQDVLRHCYDTHQSTAGVAS